MSNPEAQAAAAHALGETMWFDHAEGREAWAERVKPLCTPNGWAFWAGPFFADQVWPTMMEQRYATQNIEMLDTQVVGEGEIPDSVIVEVSLNIEYVLGQDGQPEKQENTNRVVMVNQGGQWLMDGPPKQK